LDRRPRTKTFAGFASGRLTPPLQSAVSAYDAEIAALAGLFDQTKILASAIPRRTRPSTSTGARRAMAGSTAAISAVSWEHSPATEPLRHSMPWIAPTPARPRTPPSPIWICWRAYSTWRA
jgi:hypothetical protein